MRTDIHFISLAILAALCTMVSATDFANTDLELYDALDRQINPKPNLEECLNIFNTGVPISQFGDWLAAMFQGGLDCAGMDTVDLLGLITKILVNLLFSVGCNAALSAIPGAAVLSPVICA